MEHILQFGINIDDETIKKICEEKAAEKAVSEVLEFSRDKYNRGYRGFSDTVFRMFEEQIAKVIEEHTDEIISLAVNEVTTRLMKTKKVKEAVNSVAEGVKKND